MVICYRSNSKQIYLLKKSLKKWNQMYTKLAENSIVNTFWDCIKFCKVKILCRKKQLESERQVPGKTSSHFWTVLRKTNKFLPKIQFRGNLAQKEEDISKAIDQPSLRRSGDL